MLTDLKKSCHAAGIKAKKSDILRVGLALVNALDTASLKRELSCLKPLVPQTGKNSK